ncbi:VOC family protein [Streptomyces pratensis]|uniref:VOC family protein n=1 Tax=Streptomyces pratensis TaxID=1169025 RepID=UPI003016F2C3
MTSHLHALCFDAHDPTRLARFWAHFLHWETSDDTSDGITLSLFQPDCGGEVLVSRSTIVVT